jgi:hypothetical protein
MYQSKSQNYQPQRSPEFIAIEIGTSNISTFNLTESNPSKSNPNKKQREIELKDETKIESKPTITLNQVATTLSNEFCEYLIEESRDYNLPLPVGIKETSQTKKLTNFVKKSISNTMLNISESITALNSPSSPNSEKSPKFSK